MPDPDQMRAAALKYFASFATADVDTIVSLFAEDAVVEDPIGSPPQRGHAALRAFFQAGFDHVGGGFRFEPEGAVRIAGNHAACAAIATVERASPPFRMETLDVWSFDESGKFKTMTAYYGPTNIKALSGTDQEAADRAQSFIQSLEGA